MKRIAVYCRVSTEKEDQKNSFDNQIQYFQAYITEKKEWQLYRIYADEGVSGTNTKKRVAFNQMIEDAKQGCFDVIITKEVSRFARNTIDTLYYTRLLKEYGVFVSFLVDQIHTEEPDAELRLTIMASMAQEESRKISERVKWGQKRRMEQGVVFGRDLLGYDVRKGKLYINPEGAELVKQIYYKFLEEGKSSSMIAKELTEEAKRNDMPIKHWNATTILRILKNEKYCGDLMQGKTYTPNYLTHQKKYKDREMQKIYIFDHHEPIITRERFEQTQKEWERRSRKKEMPTKRYSNHCMLSGKIICGYCGSHFVVRKKTRKDGSVYRTWRCYEAVRYGTKKNEEDIRGCHIGVQIQEVDFISMIQLLMIRLEDEKMIDWKTIEEELDMILHEIIQTQTIQQRYEAQRQELEHKIERLLDLFLSEKIQEEEYEKMVRHYRHKKERIEEQYQTIKGAEEEEQIQTIIKEIQQMIRSLQLGNEVEDILYRNVLDTITVYGREHIEIKCVQDTKKWVGNIKTKEIVLQE